MSIVFDELDQMIRMGWGDVNQPLIPSDWRTRMGPDTLERREKRGGNTSNISKQKILESEQAKREHREAVERNMARRRRESEDRRNRIKFKKAA